MNMVRGVDAGGRTKEEQQDIGAVHGEHVQYPAWHQSFLSVSAGIKRLQSEKELPFFYARLVPVRNHCPAGLLLFRFHGKQVGQCYESMDRAKMMFAGWRRTPCMGFPDGEEAQDPGEKIQPLPLQHGINRHL
jgi:hypothetical protein